MYFRGQVKRTFSAEAKTLDSKSLFKEKNFLKNLGESYKHALTKIIIFFRILTFGFTTCTFWEK